jgi:membrane associated rhomboid family serine protease
MPYTEQQYRKKISLGQKSNALTTLVAIELVVFVIFAFMKAVWFYRYQPEHDIALSFYNKNVLGWFAFPADFDRMMSQPWSIVTSMFIHDSPWIIIPNLLWLGCFGYIMQDLTGNKKLIPVFLYGSVAGAAGFMLAYNLLPQLHDQLPFASMIGASPGVMAVAIVTTLVAPDYRIFPMIKGGMPVWVLTGIYFLSDIAGVSLKDTGLLIAHLSGAIAGLIFIFFLRLGYDGSEWMNNIADWVGNLFNPDRPRKGTDPKNELYYKATETPYTKVPNVTSERIDEILDKINKDGYHFLTDEEKEILKRASKEDF